MEFYSIVMFVLLGLSIFLVVYYLLILPKKRGREMESIREDLSFIEDRVIGEGTVSEYREDFLKAVNKFNEVAKKAGLPLFVSKL